RQAAAGTQDDDEGLARAPALRVDDPALALAAADVGQQVLPRAAAVALLVGREDQVRAEEGALEAVGLLHPELADDVARDTPGRRGREGEDRRPAELLLEPAQPAVGRAEVVTPLGDAMRLVDDDQGDLHLREEPAQPTLEALGRHVDQLVLAGAQATDPLASRVPVERGVEHRGAEAVAL